MDKTQSPVAPMSEKASTNLSKAEHNSFTAIWDMVQDAPYENCSTGEVMKNVGILLIHYNEVYTPSGNVSITGWVDYKAFGQIILVGQETGKIWTLKTGTNTMHNIIKENGFYNAQWHWNEVYTNDDGENLHINLKGSFMIDKDGNVKKDLSSYTCR